MHPVERRQARGTSARGTAALWGMRAHASIEKTQMTCEVPASGQPLRESRARAEGRDMRHATVYVVREACRRCTRENMRRRLVV